MTIGEFLTGAAISMVVSLYLLVLIGILNDLVKRKSVDNPLTWVWLASTLGGIILLIGKHWNTVIW